MAGIFLVDMKCDDCGAIFEHCVTSQKEMTFDLKTGCACGAEAKRKIGGTRQNHIHTTHSSQYGKYEPCFGEYVESYSHRKELLRKYNVTEASDPVGGSRCHRDLFKESSNNGMVPGVAAQFVDGPGPA